MFQKSKALQKSYKIAEKTNDMYRKHTRYTYYVI